MYVPLKRLTHTGNEVATHADYPRVLYYHLLKMTEGDWYKPLPDMCGKRQSYRVSLKILNNPLLTEIFTSYQDQVKQFRELGQKFPGQDPSILLCNFIYLHYSYPDDDPTFELKIPEGFIFLTPTEEEQKRFRRIKRQIQKRDMANATVDKDYNFEKYLKWLQEQGIDEGSRDYVLKAIKYWGEISQNLRKDTGVRLDNKEICLRTPIGSYTLKRLREKYRYIAAKDPQFHIDYQTKNPDVDLLGYPGRMHYVDTYDREVAERRVQRLRGILKDDIN